MIQVTSEKSKIFLRLVFVQVNPTENPMNLYSRVTKQYFTKIVNKKSLKKKNLCIPIRKYFR